jgi:hypothetical protein
MPTQTLKKRLHATRRPHEIRRVEQLAVMVYLPAERKQLAEVLEHRRLVQREFLAAQENVGDVAVLAVSLRAG